MVSVSIDGNVIANIRSSLWVGPFANLCFGSRMAIFRYTVMAHIYSGSIHRILRMPGLLKVFNKGSIREKVDRF